MRTITTPQAAHILGMNYRTLDNWVRTGLVTCTQVADGRGTRRAWNVDDVTRVAFLQSLRQNGVSTHQLNAMKKSGTLDFLLDNHLKQEKTHSEERAFSDMVLVLKDRVLQTTMRPKRKAIEKAFDALEAGLPPEPLTYDDEPSGIQVQANRS
jgi:DNA-binding transcriptional MerR regulator